MNAHVRRRPRYFFLESCQHMHSISRLTFFGKYFSFDSCDVGAAADHRFVYPDETRELLDVVPPSLTPVNTEIPRI